MRKTGSLRQLLCLARLARDEEGSVLIYVSIALTVFMGFAALVIDGSRLFTLDTEMQSASDALALAGAAELDGSTDAITRATTAMDNLVRNYETFGDRSTAITGYTARFLTALPADDSQPIDYGTLETTDGTEARFVEVKLQPEGGGVDNSRSISNLFASAIGGGSTARAGATSVAGFTSAVCKFTPLFICNPYGDAETLLDKLSDWDNPSNADRRKLINLKKWGGSGKLSPGNFGFLDTPGHNGASALRNSLAVAEPLACFSQRGVDLHQGNVASVRQAINTRFDLYEGSYGGNTKNNAAYRPAMNVTKGYTVQNGSACNKQKNTLDTTNAMSLPLDGGWTQLAGTAGARWGNGNWDCATYWAWNHGPDHTATGDPARPSGCSTAANTTMSRYDMYRYEVEHPAIPNMSSLSPKGENGNPQCYTQSNTLTDPSKGENQIDRRIIYAAVLDCSALPNGNSQTEMPALAFIKMFMTRPMSQNSNNCNGNGGFDASCEEDANDLFIEIVDKVQPGTDDAVIHDIVQLYR